MVRQELEWTHGWQPAQLVVSWALSNKSLEDKDSRPEGAGSEGGVGRAGRQAVWADYQWQK